MFIHYLKVILRGLFKDKTFSLINIVGLSIAITCCFLLLFWIKFELSYEDCYTNTPRIYKLVEEEKHEDGIFYNLYMDNITQQMKDAFPQIEAATYVFRSQSYLALNENDDGVETNVVEANDDFLRIFDYEYIEGSPQDIIRDQTVIITEQVSHKFWGNKSPIGKKLYRFGKMAYTVGAVVKVPQNTQIQFDIIEVNKPVDNRGPHYIMLKNKAEMTPELKKRLSHFLTTLKGTQNTLLVQSLKSIHLHSPKGIITNNHYRTTEKYGNYTLILFLSFAVLLILFMAIINYINTSIARAINRMKEVGVRKVTGSTCRQLIDRFIFESFVITTIAVTLALAITKTVLPYFSEVMGNKISLFFDMQTIFIAVVVCIIISVLAGGYAAFYLSSFKPIHVFRGGKTTTKDTLRKFLICIQFFISIAILICTVFIYKQINSIFNEQTGMDRNNIIVLETNLWYQAEDFIKIIKQENPNIIDASMASSPPYNALQTYGNVSWNGEIEDMNEISFTEISCDYHYANTFGLEIIQGEFIPSGLTWWQYSDNKSYNIVINESFAKILNSNNLIGMSITYGSANSPFTGKIIGIVKDFNFKPLKEKTAPLFISYNPESCNSLYIKTNGNEKQATLNYILKKYKEMKFDQFRLPVMYHTVEDEYNKMYADELRALRILSVFSIICFFLSLIGVVSMVSFMIEKRTKEIAIRKINGAGVFDIISLFCQYVLKLGIIAAIPAILACFIILDQWLQGYAYRTSLSWWIFLLIPIILFSIICFIVGIQVWFTARRRPIESLRSE